MIPGVNVARIVFYSCLVVFAVGVAIGYALGRV